MTSAREFADEIAPFFEVDWGTNDIDGTERFTVDTRKIAERVAARDAAILQEAAREHRAEIQREKAAAQIEMYEMLVMLPERPHEGSCTPESWCDASCMDNAHFSDYVDGLYKLCGIERLSSRLLKAHALLSPDERSATGGSVAGKSESSPDNPPTTTARSRT